MTDILDHINESDSALEKLVSKIPGLGDFFERNDLRAADKLLREKLANRVADQQRRVNDLQQQMSSGQSLMLLDDMERAQTQLGTFADSIRTASYGYAGLFDRVKKNKKELTKMYEYDNRLYENIQDISTALDGIQAAIDGGEGLPAAVRQLGDTSRTAMKAFRRREEAILGE